MWAGAEDGGGDSWRNGGITAPSHLLITLRKGILTASQTDPMKWFSQRKHSWEMKLTEAGVGGGVSGSDP